MAGKRSIPTDLFWDETFSSLSGDTQSIFIGLVLGADDYGRGPASVQVLTRMLAKDPAVIQQALQDLGSTEFIQCYQVKDKTYYHIARWDEWETLHKPARSRYPAPPETALPAETANDVPGLSEIPPESPGNSGGISESPAISGKIRPEVEEKRREVEEKRTEEEGEQTQTPRTIIPFPTRADGGKRETEETLVKDLAQILHVPVTPALARLVTEFQNVPDLSLPGEANAARAWVDEPRQRKKSTQMSLPFFRRWLQRSRRQVVGTSSQETLRATGTTGQAGPARLPDLMHLDDDLFQAQKGGARP